MKLLAAFVLTGSITGSLFADAPQSIEEPKETDAKPTSFWMEKKMEYSQGVLRGLATGDFETIRINSAQLGLLNRIEGFVRRRNPDYRAHLHTFQRAADEIFRQANNENLEGTTLSFNQLTVSCVKCHQSLRSDSREISNSDSALPTKPKTIE